MVLSLSHDANVMHFQAPSEQNLRVIKNEIGVGIVASHLLVAHHLLELLRSNASLLPVILSEGVKSAKLFPKGLPVVILIDLWRLPLPAFEYLDAFSQAIPGCAFLALDRARTDIDVAQCLLTGFAGFVSHSEANLLVSAVEAVAVGRLWISPEVARLYFQLTSSRTAIRGAGVGTLTTRERQILDLLRRRYSNKEVADCLGISESTVKFHVSNVLMKLNVSNRRELTEKERLFEAGPDALTEQIKNEEMAANSPLARRSG